MGLLGQGVRLSALVLAIAGAVVASLAFASTAAGATGLILTMGGSGTGNGLLDSPQGISLGPDGNIYIADRGNDRVQALSSTGAFVKKVGTSGTGNSQFDEVMDVDVGQGVAGNVYAVDCGTNPRVQYFNSSLAFQGSWGGPGNGNTQFNCARTVAIAPAAGIYVMNSATSGNGKVKQFNSSGSFISTFGSFNSGAVAVEVDAAGNVYVGDGSSRAIFKYSPSPGHSLQRAWNSGNGQPFGQITDLTIDSAGSVYVADCTRQQVQKFTSDGVYLGQMNGPDLGCPSGVAVDAAGTIYLADATNDVVRKFLPSAIQAPTAAVAPTSIKGGTAGRFRPPAKRGKGKGKTTILKIIVKGEAGSAVAVTCSKCRKKQRKIGLTIGPSGKAKLPISGRLRAGTVIEIRITAPGRIGNLVRYRTRRKGAPSKVECEISPAGVVAC